MLERDDPMIRMILKSEGFFLFVCLFVCWFVFLVQKEDYIEKMYIIYIYIHSYDIYISYTICTCYMFISQ